GCALVLGVSAYQRISRLPPVSDVADVADVLRDPELCGYSPDRVEVRVDAEANRAGIFSALDRLGERAKVGSFVFLYFSGHGGRVLSGPVAECYLMPADATWRSEQDLERTAISGRELSQRLRQMEAERITVVLDCCRAAGLAEPKDACALMPGVSASALSTL